MRHSMYRGVMILWNKQRMERISRVKGLVILVKEYVAVLNNTRMDVHSESGHQFSHPHSSSIRWRKDENEVSPM